MTDLDFLKEHWNKQPLFPVRTKEELQMIIRKSSLDTLKWLIAVNIFELLFFTALSFLLGKSETVSNNRVINDLVNVLDFIIYSLPVVFSVFYFILIRKIKEDGPVLMLLKNILKARTLLSVYIYLNIGVFLTILYLTIFLTISSEQIDKNAAGTLGTTTSYIVLISICILVSLLFLLVVWFFYRLLYGRLLKKLNHNYEELKDME